MSRNFRLRIISSLVLLPIIGYILYAGEWLFAFLVWPAVVLGALEYAAMISPKGHSAPAVTSAAMALWLTISISSGSLPGFVIALMTGTALLLAVWQRARGAFIALWLLTVFVGITGGCAMLLRWHAGGPLWWLLMLSATWSTDTLAYAGGNAYGKTPLAPALSPGKTWEGALTGLVGAVLISSVLLVRFQVNLPAAIAIALGAPFFALLGDLLESAVKRRYEVKHSHLEGFNLIPGHGGLLDRVDSLMMVILYTFVVVALQPV